MKETVTQPSNGSRCRGRNRAGLPCQRRAVTVAGFCTVHDPEAPQDMKAIGKLGGRTPKLTALRRSAAEQEDSLRAKAQAVLERALDGENVSKTALDSARSLFSYRSDAPPFERHDSGDKGLAIEQGVFSMADLVRYTAAEIDLRSLPDLVAACRELVAAAEAGGARVS